MWTDGTDCTSNRLTFTANTVATNDWLMDDSSVFVMKPARLEPAPLPAEEIKDETALEWLDRRIEEVRAPL